MSSPARSLSGKVAVVTGGGRGIGRAVAEALAREGMRVAVGDLDGAAAAAVAEDLGPGHLGLELDVTNRPAFTAFLDDVEARLGPLEVIVNNAGIMPIGPFEEESDATAVRQLEINVHGVLHGTKEAVRRMRPRGSGHIVNLASITGRRAAPHGVTYSATKHAVVGLSEGVRAELRGTGVRVSVILPGFVQTELAAGTREIRLVRRTPVEEVATAIVDALRRDRFEVFVPRSLGVLVWLADVLPRRLSDTITRLLSNGALEKADPAARRAYEERAAASAPAAEIIVAETAADGASGRPDARPHSADDPPAERTAA